LKFPVFLIHTGHKQFQQSRKAHNLVAYMLLGQRALMMPFTEKDREC